MSVQVNRDEMERENEAANRDELGQRQRQIQAMRRTALGLSSQISVEDGLRETLELAVETLCADAGSILIHNSQDDTFTFRHVIGPIAERLLGATIPVRGIPGRALRSGMPVLCCDAANDVEQQQVAVLVGYPVASMMSVPLKGASGVAFGTMQIINGVHIFNHSDLEVLEVMSAIAAAAIEQARLSEESRRADMVSLIGDISHDIKNMLTPIQTGIMTLQPMLDDMFAEMTTLGEELPNPFNYQLESISLSVRENYGWMLANAQQASEQVESRTREIADAVKGESAAPQFEPTNINSVVEEVLSAHKLMARTAQVQLDIELDFHLPKAELDRKQIYNALYNLMNNAVAATPAGGQVWMRTNGENHDFITVAVQDTGHGMPESVRQRLFSVKTISTKPGGTGLGTKIVGDVVRRHNGEIRVESVEGQGSTFTLCLPVRQANRVVG